MNLAARSAGDGGCYAILRLRFGMAGRQRRSANPPEIVEPRKGRARQSRNQLIEEDLLRGLR